MPPFCALTWSYLWEVGVHLVDTAVYLLVSGMFLGILEKRHCFLGLGSICVISHDCLYSTRSSLLGAYSCQDVPVPSSSDPERVLCLVASSPTRAEFLNISVLSCDWSRLTAPLERSQRDCYSSRDSAPAPQYKLLWWQISVSTPCWSWPWEGAWSYGKHTFRTLKFSNPWFGLLRGSWGSTVLCILRRVSSRLTKIGADQVGIRVREDLLTRPWPSLTHQGLWWS